MSAIKIDIVQDRDKMKALLPDDIVTIGAKNSQETKMPLPLEAAEGGYSYAFWGMDNMLPNRIREKLEAVPIATSTIYKLAAMMYGNGVAYYRVDDLKDGYKVKRAYDKKIETWLEDNCIDRYLIAQFVSYRYYMNNFSEIILSRDKSRAVEIHHHESEFCRVTRRDTMSNKRPEVVYSPDFALGIPVGEARSKNVPLYQHKRGFVDSLSRRQFFYHSKFPTPASTYYARPLWLGLTQKNGWLDVSANVPRIISAMQNNQVKLKYQINIPEAYFEIRHPDWPTYTAKQRKDVINKKVDQMNNVLQGTDNAYQSLVNVFKEDYQGKAIGKIEIIAVDDKTKKDEWVPDSNFSDAQIVLGLTMHPSQMGLQPQGGKMGAGSGSDQRESYNTQISLNTMDQRIILEPLNLVSRINGWGVRFFIDHTAHTTTNKKEDGLMHNENNLIVE